jgi:hypothetical protein
VADGTVAVRDATGTTKLIDNETLTVGGQSVNRQRVVTESGMAVTAVVATTSSAGDNTVLAVAANKQLQLRWIACQAQPDGSTTPMVKVLIGTTEVYRAYGVVQHAQVFTGAAGEDLVVNVSDTTAVVVTAHYELLDA